MGKAEPQPATGAAASPAIPDLAPGMPVRGIFVVKKKVCREQANGAPFLLFQFSNRSGHINGVMWDRVDAARQDIATGDLAHVQGEVQLYQSTRQIRVHTIVRADPRSFDLSAFLPTAAADLEALFAGVLASIDSVQDPHLRRLYSDIFRDADVSARFRCAPAGKGWHHAYLGGLLEHVASMLELGEVLVRQHPALERDLLIGGILLHDIGKIEELACKSHIEYTQAGRLVGHLVQGCLLVSRFADRIEGFPDEQRARVLHMLVSHHGSLERGSPKPPMTLEAVAVHLLDHLDSQVHGVEQVVLRPGGEDGWSEHVKLLDRFFYCGPPSDGAGGGA